LKYPHNEGRQQFTYKRTLSKNIEVDNGEIEQGCLNGNNKIDFKTKELVKIQTFDIREKVH
jgi:hypothetical protein